jgi:hypothetical protein
MPQNIEASGSHNRFDRGTFTEQELEEIFSDSKRRSTFGRSGSSQQFGGGDSGPNATNSVRNQFGHNYPTDSFSVSAGSKRTQN